MVAAAAVGVRSGVGRTMLHTTMRIASARAMSTTAARAKPSPSAPRAFLRLARPTHSSVRTFSTTTIRRAARAGAGGRGAVETGTELAKYEGPLGRTFSRLKLFSLSSLGVASVLTPVLLLAPGEISLAGRIGLCVTALATSGVSTALIAWIGTPYVNTMRLLSPSSPGTASKEDAKVVMELNTVSWRLKPQRTLVYEPTFLRPTSRPFAAWEITNAAPPLPLPLPDGQETVVKKIAETFDVKSGASLGSYSVTYSSAHQDAQGRAVGSVQVQGKPTRYFNVHEELLDESWQVLG